MGARRDVRAKGDGVGRGASAFDVASIRREIDHMVSCARAGDSHLVTLRPLLFFSSSSGDAWMLDPSDGSAACLARDGVAEVVEIRDEEGTLAIEWPSSYLIEGETMVFVESSTGRVTRVFGYPTVQVETASRRMRR